MSGKVRVWKAASIHGLAAIAVAGLGVGCGGGDDPAPPGPAPTASVLSSRSDMVSDGSALVRVQGSSGSALSSGFKASAAGKDVTAQFSATPDGSMVGLVSGLQLGSNDITITANGSATATLTVVNHDRNGPIISGPQQKPWVCQTATFLLPDSSNLGAPQDASCNAPTKVQYYYMPTGGTAFKPVATPGTVPTDVATTTTTDGHAVNYIVRLETGTLNRGVYQFAALHDPSKEAAAPSPTATYQGWNKKVVFTFGGGASAGYIQGTGTGGVMNDLMLSKGFAVISHSLNVFGNNENDVLGAESASMTKEKFIKTFGVPLYTMGWGGSGGSIEQHMIANNYPGLLDGINPGLSFPDSFSIIQRWTDCSLMSRGFANSGQIWTDAQKAAVAGYLAYTTCTGSNPQSLSLLGAEQAYSPAGMLAKQYAQIFFGFLDASNCLLTLPAALTYDPISNPTGARCGFTDSSINQLGVDPLTGFANRPWDNVGVQYGKQALDSGVINLEQFITLNEKAGGYDSDGNFQPGRTQASIGGLNAVYAYGRINEGANLAGIPIIDSRTYQDPDLHEAVNSLIMRARLVRSNGDANNQVILRAQGAGSTAMNGIVLDAMDRWLSNMIKDTKSYPSVHAKVVANKPADVVDACYTTTGTKIAEPADINNGGQCGTLYPYHSGPRNVAGSPLTDDVMKCQLKPLLRSDYPGVTDAQFGRLQAVFPTGVCDYAKPSIGQVPLKAPWLTYSTPGVANALTATP